MEKQEAVCFNQIYHRGGMGCHAQDKDTPMAMAGRCILHIEMKY